MKTIKQIPRPDFTSARRLKPLEMNAIRINRRHTILTPDQLDRLARSSVDASMAQ